MTLRIPHPITFGIRDDRWELCEHIKVTSQPATAGSKRAFHSKKTGKTWITDDCKRGKEWRATVRAAAEQQRITRQLYDGPLLLYVEFWLRRPKNHYRTGKFSEMLKVGAPKWPTKKPDTTKLLRAIEDALTGVLWVDDAQIGTQLVTKSYAPLPGALVRLYTFNED